MRKIKFRAWDTDLNKYVHAFNYNDYEISDDEGDIYITKNMETSGETPLLELEQFTGLFDKNGKEIYEGDIVRQTVLLSGESVNNPVKWIDCGFIANGLLGTREAENCEVIGNINENKDLLKGGN